MSRRTVVARVVAGLAVLALLPACRVPATPAGDGGPSVDRPAVPDTPPAIDTGAAPDLPVAMDVATPVDVPTDLHVPPADTGAAASDAGAWARLGVATRWHIDLETPVDLAVDADAYDLDLFDNPAATVATLHRRGVRVVCYFSAGSGEDWRPDYHDLPAAALGLPLDGWAGERWLDIRAAGVRRVMLARLDLARTRGCDGVDPDNVDGRSNTTGFPLSAADQLDYNRFLAREAHARGLAVGLKNDVDQVAILAPDFDFAINESCHVYDECDREAPFIALGRAVLDIEYAPTVPQRTAYCADAARRRFDLVLPPRDRLDGTYARCP